MKIEGSVAVVTGANRGLGRHFVEQLLSRGAAKVYAAAKAAAWAQTDVVREELASHGVDVTALHVGYMDTDMTANVEAPKEDPGVVAALALDGVEDGLIEVLADQRSRDVKSQLSVDRGAVTSAAPAP